MAKATIQVRTGPRLLASSAIDDSGLPYELAGAPVRIADIEKVRDVTLETTIIPIQLDFAGGLPIVGELHVYRRHACVTVSRWDTDLLDPVQARTALLHAVKDGRIKVPDSVAEAIDLVGPKPRIA